MTPKFPPVQHVIAESFDLPPPTKKPMKPDPNRSCGWCHQETQGDYWRSLPTLFSQWSTTGIDPARPWLCKPCASAMALRPTRTTHIEAHATLGATELGTPTDLKRALSTPIEGSRAVLVQTNFQKRSLINAGWGWVATCHDGHRLPWDTPQVNALEDYDRLRHVHGVSEKAIDEPGLRSSLLLSSPDVEDMIRLWERGEWWRTDPVLLEVLKLATRKPKQREA